MDELNVYQVFKNGNELVMSNANKQPCLRKCLSLAKDKSICVELWYVHSNGQRVLCRFWN